MYEPSSSNLRPYEETDGLQITESYKNITVSSAATIHKASMSGNGRFSALYEHGVTEVAPRRGGLLSRQRGLGVHDRLPPDGESREERH